jgi:hypothetical protein
MSIAEASLSTCTTTAEVITLLSCTRSSRATLADLYYRDDAIFIDDFTGSDALLTRSDALTPLTYLRLGIVLTFAGGLTLIAGVVAAFGLRGVPVSVAIAPTSSTAASAWITALCATITLVTALTARRWLSIIAFARA